MDDFAKSDEKAQTKLEIAIDRIVFERHLSPPRIDVQK